MKRILILTVAALMVMTLPSLAHANLLSNAGFEDGPEGQFVDGSTTLVPGWQIWGTDGYHHSDWNHTSGGSKAIRTWWDSAGIFQDFSVTADTSYDFSGYAYSPSSDPLTLWNGLFKVEWYGDSGKIGEDEIGRFYGATDPDNTWKYISNTKTAPTGAVTSRVVLNLVDWQEGVGGTLGWDDMSVEANPIPEPTSMLLLGTGLLGLFVLRRKPIK